MAGIGNTEHPGGWALVAAAVVGYVAYQILKPKVEWYTPLPEHTTIADPGVGMRTLKTEDSAKEDADDDTDVNEEEVPKEQEEAEGSNRKPTRNEKAQLKRDKKLGNRKGNSEKNDDGSAEHTKNSRPSTRNKH